MKILILSLFFSSMAHAYVPLWEKACREKMKKTDLYEIYNDCLELCMPASRLHREKTIKEKVRVCTLFTARFHNTSFEKEGSGDAGASLRKGLEFCHKQPMHQTGGHWLAISRKCKRVICDYNPKVAIRENDECKDIHKYLHNGKIKAAKVPANKKEIERKK